MVSDIRWLVGYYLQAIFFVFYKKICYNKNKRIDFSMKWVDIISPEAVFKA